MCSETACCRKQPPYLIPSKQVLEGIILYYLVGPEQHNNAVANMATSPCKIGDLQGTTQKCRYAGKVATCWLLSGLLSVNVRLTETNDNQPCQPTWQASAFLVDLADWLVVR